MIEVIEYIYNHSAPLLFGISIGLIQSCWIRLNKQSREIEYLDERIQCHERHFMTHLLVNYNKDKECE